MAAVNYRSRIRNALWLAIAGLALLGVVFLGTVTVNKHARFQMAETWAHYLSKVLPLEVAVCGDSIGAGGRHWHRRLGLAPLRTRNLAGNGYTLHQITSQVKKARVDYRPKLLIVFGGTNDAIHLAQQRLDPEMIRSDFKALANTMGDDSWIMVLPPPSQHFSVEIDRVRDIIRREATKLNVRFVDPAEMLADRDGRLMDRYSQDGIHLTEAAYDEIGMLLRKTH
jgi:lysophospholipase L1-like esterase